MKYTYPCCGYHTYPVPAERDCGFICPVCYWENDSFLSSDIEPSDSNHGLTLMEAKENYIKIGLVAIGIKILLMYIGKYEASVSLIIRLICGVYGNYIYFKHCKKKAKSCNELRG